MTTITLPKINLSNKIDKTTIFEKTDESISINKTLFTKRPNKSPYTKNKNDLIVINLEDIYDKNILSNIMSSDKISSDKISSDKIMNTLIENSINLSLIILSLTICQYNLIEKDELINYCNSLLYFSKNTTEYNKIKLAFNILMEFKHTKISSLISSFRYES